MLALLFLVVSAHDDCNAPDPSATCTEMVAAELAPFTAMLRAARPNLDAKRWSAPWRPPLRCRGEAFDTVQFVLPCADDDACWVQAAFERDAGGDWRLIHAYRGEGRDRLLWDATVDEATAKAAFAAAAATFGSAFFAAATTRTLMSRDEYMRECRCARGARDIGAAFIVIFDSERAESRYSWEIFLIDGEKPRVIGASINARWCASATP